MKIQIRKVGLDGADYVETFDAEWAGLKEKDPVYFTEPLKIQAHATRAEDELIVEIASVSRYAGVCDRCLERVTGEWNKHMTLNYEIAKNQEFVDLDDEIRQEIILNLPARHLCREDCKGLCVDCGINLNKQECKHMHSVVIGNQ